MNILLFDSIGGAAGDMILASLIDLGVDAVTLCNDLETLGIGPFRIVPQPFSDAGLHGLRLEISLPDHATSSNPPFLEQPHSHSHAHAHPHNHGHEHNGGRANAHHHHHAGSVSAHGGRGLAEIRKIISDSGLPQTVKDDSIRIFQRLAEAEARVHRCEPETVHFHEVGALDSILDIVGCCLARHRLEIDAVMIAPLPLGRGSFTCGHGILPIPAPATLELLHDFPVVRTDEPFEMVTPTGAAILTSWQTSRDAPVSGRIMRTGHGFGTRTLTQRPNLLRAVLMTSDPESPPASERDTCVELTCNLDDMTPEWVGPLIPQLIEAGALDAYITPVIMKKMRPAFQLTVLCRPADRLKLTDFVFSATTTFGLRWRVWERQTLNRRHVEVQTPYGKIRVKIGSRSGADLVRSPEFEDCQQSALKHKVTPREVYAAALAAL